MPGVTFIAVGPSRRTGEYMAGYMRPTQPGVFVPLVVGCPSELVAISEAQRLAREAEARTAPVIEDHQFRVGHWYGDDE